MASAKPRPGQQLDRGTRQRAGARAAHGEFERAIDGRSGARLLPVFLTVGAHDAHAAQGLGDEGGEIAGFLKRLRGRFPHLAALAREHEPGDRHEDQDQHREARVHVEHGADQDDHLEIVLAKRDHRAAGRRPDQRGVVEEAGEETARMHRLDPAQIGARQLGEHLNAQIGDEPIAEIIHRDVGDIFGDRLDDGHHHDGAADPVDHLLVLADEHVVGGLLDEEGYGAGGRRGQQHGDRRDQQEPDAGPEMLLPDAPDDRAGRILDLEFVRAPRDRAGVPEQLIFQAVPRFPRLRQEGLKEPFSPSSMLGSTPLRRKSRRALCRYGAAPPGPWSGSSSRCRCTMK